MSWLENGPEIHAACCKVNQQHVPAHSSALLVLTRSALHQHSSPVVTQGASLVPSNDIHSDSIAFILCFWQFDLSICVRSLNSILLVRLTMGLLHGPSATSHWRDSDTG